MKRKLPWGSVFLALAFAGWLASNLPPWPEGWITAVIRAFFDWSLAGALADWFAVTALFRKPAGLPFPHTDLLVRRKAELAQALPRFLTGFLEPAHLHPLLRELDYATALETHWDSAALSRWLGEPVAAGWANQALTGAARLLHDDLARRRPDLLDPVTGLIKKRAGWKGLFVGRDTVDELFEGLLAELEAVHDDPRHPVRPLLLQALSDSLVRWSDPPPWGTTAEARRAFNLQAADAVIRLWVATGAAEKLAASLTFVLQKTDARELYERIRMAVGEDLQAIRVNGALVGGLAGVLLQTATSLILGR